MSIQSIFLQLTTASPLLQELKMCLPNGGGGKGPLRACEGARQAGEKRMTRTETEYKCSI